jgi:signal transduction histidine kinase
VALIAAIDSGLPPVRGDADRLRQVVWNLIGNAIKFTPEGGRITVTLTVRGERLRLEVTDTGDGIAPEFLPHVFERYRQAAGLPAAQRGVGLGLAIVQHLVELHGGTVSAHSDGVGRGATFVVEIPTAPVA